MTSWLNRIVLALLWIAGPAATVALTQRTIAPVGGDDLPPHGATSYRYPMGYAQRSMRIYHGTIWLTLEGGAW